MTTDVDPSSSGGANPSPLKLVGISEIADLTGLSRQAVSNLKARDERFPTPVADLRSGPVYDEHTIRAYFQARDRDLEPTADRLTVRRFDPLSRESLAASAGRELLAQPRHRLDTGFEAFPGVGLFALYYTGEFEPYRVVSGTDTPLYIGFVTARRLELDGDVDGPALWYRLRDAIGTLLQAESHGRESGEPHVELADFECRLLVLDSLWVQLASRWLIRTLKPLWNAVLTGFGNHLPGRLRQMAHRSAWDEFHPGRPWAMGLRPATHSSDELAQMVEQHLSG